MRAGPRSPAKFDLHGRLCGRKVPHSPSLASRARRLDAEVAGGHHHRHRRCSGDATRRPGSCRTAAPRRQVPACHRSLHEGPPRPGSRRAAEAMRMVPSSNLFLVIVEIFFVESSSKLEILRARLRSLEPRRQDHGDDVLAGRGFEVRTTTRPGAPSFGRIVTRRASSSTRAFTASRPLQAANLPVR